MYSIADTGAKQVSRLSFFLRWTLRLAVKLDQLLLETVRRGGSLTAERAMHRSNVLVNSKFRHEFSDAQTRGDYFILGNWLSKRN